MNFTKTSLPLLAAALLGLGACAGAPTSGTASPLQAADSKGTGSTSDPAATSTCKESTDPSGVPCKICVDSSGAISYDDCSGGASGAGGSGGLGGSGGSSTGDVKCVATTDATTGAACKTCYAADGSSTSSCAPPPSGCVDASGKNACGAGGSGGTASGGTTGSGGSGVTTVKCVPTTDPSTGAACQTCYAADGTIASNDCSGGTEVKCAPATDPITGAPCQTCYAPDGSISSNTCSPATGGSGASCVAAPNIETGQICKVCSDSVSGKLLFVDCPNLCASTSGTGTTAPPPAK